MAGVPRTMKQWTQTSLFDAAESRRHADIGIERAAENRASLVVRAREIAVKICKRQDTVNMDEVVLCLVAEGQNIHALGPAAGSIFRDRNFEWTGKFVKSSRIHAHSNLLRVWRLKV